MRRSLLARLGVAIAFVAVNLVVLEVALRALGPLGFRTPAERPTEPPSFYRDDDPVLGVWRYPNASFRAQSECFDVIYTTNSVGARDVERSVASERPRTLVLGDSFVEGTGVAQGHRVTDLLEQWSGVEHLNFGSAGNFSSVQEWLLYETVASRYEHDWLLLFLLPYNDFLENDPERFYENYRYRPYLRRTDGGFEVFYPVDRERAAARARDQLWWNRIYNALYVYRLVAYLDGLWKIRSAYGDTGPFGYSGYEQFTEEDLARIFYSYERIRDLAAGREFWIVSIPRLNDLLAARANGSSGPLPERMAEFAEREPGIRYIDLMPGFLADAQREGRELADYFLPCDGHWSDLGHRVAAKIVLEALAPEYAARNAGR